MTHIVDDILARKEILRRLVFEDASSGLIDRCLGQDAMVVQSRNGTLCDDIVDLFLIVISEFIQCDSRVGDQRIDHLLYTCVILLFCHMYRSILYEVIIS